MSASQLRQLAADHIAAHPDDFLDFLVDDSDTDGAGAGAGAGAEALDDGDVGDAFGGGGGAGEVGGGGPAGAVLPAHLRRIRAGGRNRTAWGGQTELVGDLPPKRAKARRDALGRRLPSVAERGGE